VQVFRRNGNIRQISFGLLDMTYHEKTKHWRCKSIWEKAMLDKTISWCSRNCIWAPRFRTFFKADILLDIIVTNGQKF
jgi:hypothetical protein